MIQSKLTNEDGIEEIEFRIPKEAFLQKYVKDGRDSLYVKSKIGKEYPAICYNKKQYSQIEPGDWVWVLRTHNPGSRPKFHVRGWFPSKENPKDIKINTIKC